MSNPLVARNPSKRAEGFMSLPIELVLVIAQHLSDTGRSGDLAALTRLLKVGWGYTYALQGVLFGRIHLETYERCNKLMLALRPADTCKRNYRLAPMVRNLSVILNTQPAPGQRPFLAEHALRLYGKCPQLTHITLAGVRVHRPHELIIPAEIGPSSFERLVTIQNLTVVCPLEPLGLLLLRYLPRLIELRIVGGPVRFQLGDRPPRSGSNLRRVTWAANTPPDALSIMWLFAHSADVTGGEITILTPPYMKLEFERIRDYALQRGMNFRSPPV
ncbi:hypothetical protein BDV93DRAFT_199359 [Ceratobasidium sp. AG-I]|nr:hypothetical protein BDV93DRAFT_199359 [Ceratobasidium sp. AG-I]